MAGGAPKLKLLCLHGYMQNAEIFRSRIGSMRKALKSRVEFVFVDAPFEAQGLPGDDPEEVQGVRDGRSWWQWTDTGPAGRPSKAASYTGWPEAQSLLLAALREHQPDGLLGFSQGATAAALLLSHLASPDVEAEAGEKASPPQGGTLARPALPQLKCAILVAGFLPRDPAVAAVLQGRPPSGDTGGVIPEHEQQRPGAQRNTVPLMFVTGTSDLLVPPERTAQLYECFDPATVSSYTHGGAHMVPTCSGEFKSSLVAFLDAAAAGGQVPALHRVQSQAGGLSASQSAASLSSTDGNGAVPTAPGPQQPVEYVGQAARGVAGDAGSEADSSGGRQMEVLAAVSVVAS